MRGTGLHGCTVLQKTGLCQMKAKETIKYCCSFSTQFTSATSVALWITMDSHFDTLPCMFSCKEPKTHGLKAHFGTEVNGQSLQFMLNNARVGLHW